MAKRRMGLISFLVCFIILVMPCFAKAAYTTDATEPVSTSEQCTLTISYLYNGTAFPDAPIKLYRVAGVNEDCDYSLTSTYADTGLILNGIRTNGEWRTVRSTLESYIVANAIEPDFVLNTDTYGSVCFENLETGLYFAIAPQMSKEELKCDFASAIVSLPSLDEYSKWQYEVDVYAKPKATDFPGDNEELQLSVLKLWKGDESGAYRPDFIDVDIYRDGILYETVVLSEDNNWSYIWSTSNDGASWIVSEHSIPKGYVMTLNQHGTSFIITNTFDADDPYFSDPP